MQLYYFPPSSFCQKVMIAFNEKGLEFEPHLVSPFDSDAYAQFMEVYPMGKIPIMLDGDHKVPESSIIIEYLDHKFPQTTQLIPSDKELSRKTRFTDRMLDLYLNMPAGKLLLASINPDNDKNSDEMNTARRYIQTSYQFLDQHLQEGQWVMGEEFTLADCAALPALVYANKSIPVSDYPNIAAYLERGCVRPSFAKALSEAEPYLEKMGIS